MGCLRTQLNPRLRLWAAVAALAVSSITCIAQPLQAPTTSARNPGSGCDNAFVPPYDTDYMRTVSIAVALKSQMMCLAAMPAGLDEPVDFAVSDPKLDAASWTPEVRKQAEGSLRSKRAEEAAQVTRQIQALREQVQVLAANIAKKERAVLPALAVLTDLSWPRLHRTHTLQQNESVVRATGAQLVAEQRSTDKQEAWSLWLSRPAKESLLLVFIANAVDGGSRFQLQALVSPGRDAATWFDAFRQRLEVDGEGTFVNSRNKCSFGRAAFERTYVVPNAGVIYRLEGEDAMVALSSNGGREAFDATLPHLRNIAPIIAEYLARFEQHSLVPGPHSSTCGNVPLVSITAALGEPGMSKAAFRRLWGDSNGGRYVLNGQALDVFPAYVDGKLWQLNISPAIDYKAGGSLYDSPRPLWKPRSHQEVVDALSKALGPAARQVVETDQTDRDHYRTVWRAGGNTAVVLKNPVLLEGAVNTQAQLQ